MGDDAALSVWTVYSRPPDQPNAFVALRCELRAGRLAATGDMVTASTLDELRGLLPPGLICLPRFEAWGDPEIVEAWF